MQTEEKYIDEGRQGEALITLPTGNATKKLFRKLWMSNEFFR